MTSDPVVLPFGDVYAFLSHEARLLDRGLFKEWLELFAENGTYWIPSRPGQTDARQVPSIVYEDKHLLGMRVHRLLHPRAHALHPAPRTLHALSNLDLVRRDDAKGEIAVASALIVAEYQDGRRRTFAGQCEHVLRRAGGELQDRVETHRSDRLRRRARGHRHHPLGWQQRKRHTMKGKLRHIAISVPDLETAAQFYEKTFGFKRMKEGKSEKFGHAVGLSDGVMNLTLLWFPTDESSGDERGKDFHGIHHMGFVVDDIIEASQEVVKNGGRLARTMGENEMNTAIHKEGFELKCRDPNGVVFDVSRGWVGIKLD
jgi:3-phenylpropionate/cinnamic acid dioxygenase small subunit/predicted enzyme related to lactoylglutathione lyase